MHWHGAACLVAHVFVAAIACPAAAADRFSHQGKVIDAVTKKPLAKVRATAYASTKRAEKSPCPQYESFLDDEESAADGGFTLRIPATNSSYVVTYCIAAYDVFTREANDNVKDGSLVEPEPVRLFPVGGDGQQMAAAITHVRNDAKRAVATLAKANVLEFAKAATLLDEPERLLVQSWAAAALQSNPTNAGPASPLNLGQIVRTVRATLTYFKEASPEHFHSEIERFEDLHAYTRTSGIEPPESIITPSASPRIGSMQQPASDEHSSGTEFIVRIFFNGLIAFVPSADETELMVLLLNTPHESTLEDGSSLPHHMPMVIARAANCEGTCTTSDHAALAGFLYGNRTSQQAITGLDSAILGGAAWKLSNSDLTLIGPKAPLTIRNGVRARMQDGSLQLIPTTPAEREDFSWVADLSALAPGSDGFETMVASARTPPGSLIAARLMLRSGKVFTYSLVRIDDKARPMRFRTPSGEGHESPYMQAVANWVAAEIRVPGDTIELLDQNFTDSSRKRSMKLHPQGGVVEIAVLNQPPFEAPAPDSEPSAPAKQFQLYYELAKKPQAPAKRLLPYVAFSAVASEPQVDWAMLHPRQLLWSNLLEALRISPRSPMPYELALPLVRTR